MLSSPIRCLEIVGRTRELEHLLARRRDASEQRGGGVLIGGEAGIGKTRLLSAFAEACMRTRTRLVRGACREFAQSPLGPLIDVLSQLGEPTDGLRAMPSAEAQLAAIESAFERIFARRTTVVVIEDVHWAGRELIQTLTVLVAAAAAQRALFVVTYRDDEMVASHPNFIAFGKLAREHATSTIGLLRFSLDETIDFLGRALGTTAEASRVELIEVARRSDGNPLFAEELLRHTVDARERPGETRGIPLTLEAVVSERIARCLPRERAILETAALFGRTFDRTELLSLDDEALPTESELARLVDYQLLERDASTRRYAFRHALTRDVMYAAVPHGVALVMHERIADALDERVDAAKDVVEIAHHRWQSGDRVRAAAPCEAAGAIARAQFAWDDCIRWYERAIVAHGDDTAAAARVRLELGKALIAAHDPARGIAEYEAVARWAADRDMHLFVRARKLIAGPLANDGHPERAIALLEETLAALDSRNDAELAAELTLRITSYLMMRPDLREARDSLARLDPTVLASATRAEYLMLRSTIYAHDPNAEAAWRDDAAAACEAYAAIGAEHFKTYVQIEFGTQAMARGDLETARRSLVEASAFTRESATSTNHLPLAFALVECAAGRFDAARAYLAEVSPSPVLISRTLETLVRAQLALADDDTDELRRSADFPLIAELDRANDMENTLRLTALVALTLVRLDRRREADALIARVAPLAMGPFDIVPAVLAMATIQPRAFAAFRLRLEAYPDDAFLAAAAVVLRAEELRDAGEAMDATTLAHARGIFERAGWRLLAARAAELAGDRSGASHYYRLAGHRGGLRRLGIGAFRERDALEDVVAESPLTERERDVALLIASGKSNREAAAALSVSVKTVEKHLSSAYQKLGLQSRAQLAAFVAGARPNEAS
jgi:DNA-binding CsgD family transcriptional regulator